MIRKSPTPGGAVRPLASITLPRFDDLELWWWWWGRMGRRRSSNYLACLNDGGIIARDIRCSTLARMETSAWLLKSVWMNNEKSLDPAHRFPRLGPSFLMYRSAMQARFCCWSSPVLSPKVYQIQQARQLQVESCGRHIAKPTWHGRAVL